MYIPDAVGSMRVGGPAAATGRDGSQAGLGTRDVINDAVVVGGLALPSAKEEVKMEVEEATVRSPSAPAPHDPVKPESDEQRALRELLSGHQDSGATPLELEAISSARDTFQSGPQDETSAFRTDLQTRPDEPSLDAYARVPVGQFGAALLRGMGWKEGTAASRIGRAGPTEAYVPKARPAMLGIGAKPMAEVVGGEKDRNGRPVKRSRAEDMRFVPLVRKERTVESGASVSERRHLAVAGVARARASRMRNASGKLIRIPLPMQQTPAGEITNGSSAPSRAGSSTPAPSRPRSKSPPPRSSRSSDQDRDSHRDRSDRDRDSNHRSRSHRDRSRSPRRDDDRRDRERRDRDKDRDLKSGGHRSSRREEESRRDRDDRDRRDGERRDREGRDRRDDRRRD